MAAIDSSVIDRLRFNPLATNNFRSRDDVLEACKCLFTPLLPYFSPGKARVQIDSSTSTWDRAACDLEGWARPLFGIAPMVAGGGEFAHWDLYREGLKNGTDPGHPEYWGDVKDMDQRHVEAAAIGFALMLVPEHLWEPLDEEAKGTVARWLLMSREGEHAPNNHMFFRICKCTYVLVSGAVSKRTAALKQSCNDHSAPDSVTLPETSPVIQVGVEAGLGVDCRQVAHPKQPTFKSMLRVVINRCDLENFRPQMLLHIYRSVPKQSTVLSAFVIEVFL